MILCDYGKDYTSDESVGCQNEARLILQYSVDWSLLKGNSDHPHAADMEAYSCKKHIFEMSFVFNPVHGLPERILDLEYNRWRPGLVRKIERLCEVWRTKQPIE